MSKTPGPDKQTDRYTERLKAASAFGAGRKLAYGELTLWYRQQAPAEPPRAFGSRYSDWSALAAAFGGGGGYFFFWIFLVSILRTGPFGAVQKIKEKVDPDKTMQSRRLLKI